MNYDNITYPLDKIYSKATGVSYPVSGAQGSTPVPPDERDYLYIENTFDGENTVTIYTYVLSGGSEKAQTVEYSKDKRTWTTVDISVSGSQSFTLGAGEKVYFRNNSGKWNTTTAHTSLRTNKSSTIGGNKYSLVDYTDMESCVLGEGMFSYLFQNNYGLNSIPSGFLPETTLANNCYNHMYSNCNGLTTLPENLLPATTLAQGCYNSMFHNCNNLTTVPQNLLPATTLATGCYYEMFLGTKLTTAPALPATNLAQGCYTGMFQSCTSLTTAPALPATTLAYNCYSNMFMYCESLRETPVLPATTPLTGCYNQMFSYCMHLNKVTIYLEGEVSPSSHTAEWLEGVDAVGDFYNLGNATLQEYSGSGIPNGWTEHTTL